ncbi:MAG: gliding motility-associated-like protein [Crocinitomix sp.]|jgi:gliding motility-associated-like protein
MKLHYSFIALLLCLCSLNGYAQDSQNKSSLKFIPNHGQIADRNYEPRSDVLFQVEGNGMFLRKDGFTFVLTNLDYISHEIHEKVEKIEESEAGLGVENELNLMFKLLEKETLKTQQVSMTFLRANPTVEVEAHGKSEDYLNYYLPQCQEGIIGVPMYDQLNLLNLYKGINLHYYGNSTGELKYDIHITAQANPNQIKCKWTGADDVSVQPDGRLLIKTQIRDVYESLPKVYQIINADTIIISANYRVKNLKDHAFLVSYILGKYDSNYELVIDPWVTNYGGTQIDAGLGVDADDENVVMVGLTASLTGIYQDGFSEVLTGYMGMFATKFNDTGDRIWGTYYGGVSNDNGNGVKISADGDIYVVGTTGSPDGISFEGFQEEIGGTKDAFLVKFNASGERLWATYYGEYYAEEGNALFIGEDGSVYITGTTTSATGMASPDGFQLASGGDMDAFLVKFNEDGDRLWATFYGGEMNDWGYGVGSDQDENVYLVGYTVSADNISTPFSYQEELNLEGDAFFVKFNAAGERIWGTYFGGEGLDDAKDVVTDSLNNVYITGRTRSLADISYEGYQMVHGGGDDFINYDPFLTKFNPSGEMLWATYFGGAADDYAISIDIDPENNNIIICGDTYSADFPVSDCAFQQTLIGLENSFVTQFLPSGDLYCSSFFGAAHEENNVSAFGGCYIYIVGTSPVGVATDGAHQEEYGGGALDAYLAQVYKSSCGIELPELVLTTTINDVEDCVDCDGEVSVHVSSAGCVGLVSYLNYTWCNGMTFENTLDTVSSISGLCAGDYWVLVELSCGVADTLFFEFGSELNVPIADFTATNLCVDKPVNFTNLSATDIGTIISYSWLIDAVEVGTEETFEHVFDSPGTYVVSLVVLNSYGCVDSVSYEILIHPNFDVHNEITICQDSLVTFMDGNQIVISNDTIYSVLLNTIFGCDSLIITTVHVLPKIERSDTLFVDYETWVDFPDGDKGFIEETHLDTSVLTGAAGCDSIIFTTYFLNDISFNPPNIFTPNGDNANNTFYFPQENVLTFECVIVNRWGIEVFHFNSISDNWDGKNEANGKACPDGVYFFTYKGTFISNAPFQGQGTVQLIRN